VQEQVWHIQDKQRYVSGCANELSSIMTEW